VRCWLKSDAPIAGRYGSFWDKAGVALLAHEPTARQRRKSEWRGQRRFYVVGFSEQIVRKVTWFYFGRFVRAGSRRAHLVEIRSPQKESFLGVPCAALHTIVAEKFLSAHDSSDQNTVIKVDNVYCL
jgi:hypothetical protein